MNKLVLYKKHTTYHSIVLEALLMENNINYVLIIPIHIGDNPLLEAIQAIDYTNMINEYCVANDIIYKAVLDAGSEVYCYTKTKSDLTLIKLFLESQNFYNFKCHAFDVEVV